MSENPKENLRNESWSLAEVEGLHGRRVSFPDGSEGTVRTAAGLVKNGEIYEYAIEVTPDGGPTTLYTKADLEMEAFAVLPGPPVSEEELASLPPWGL